MPTVREFFLTEAGEHLDALVAVLNRADASTVHAEELHRRARALRGSAQMARERLVEHVASVLETVARRVLRHELDWSADLLDRARQTVDDLRTLVQEAPAEADAERRAETAAARWHGLGLPVPTSPGPAGDAEAAAAAGPAAAASAAELRRYAAQEAGGVLTELEAALPVLAREPRNREPLKAILRRQRALLGVAALDSLPVLAETLRALDEVTRLVARHKVAVEGPWLELYRAASDVLQELVPRVARRDAGDAPPPALERLRSVRDRLVRQYGDDDGDRRPAPAPGGGGESAQDQELFRREAGRLLDRMARMAADLPDAPEAQRSALRRELREALTAMRDNARTFGFTEVADVADRSLARVAGGDPAEPAVVIDQLRDAAGLTEQAAGDVVPIETLCYRGEAALRRALELEPRVRAAVTGDPAGRELADELFDLMRLALE